ncbi:polyprenyl synthetase family protein [Natranaerobius thermophilus]|uniref:Farnesyl diphosphate synthase n=1 Tax=Natranaerobius thermophilus (strain ATCC BAA-1301 / DSM 18059 / JW/NM-WN-LF) TaxID=457570 RepID=B2A529_NATTJ|nr:farnesyl diphosphate synthase [Natranaerobius thermophilus]ACB85271.1 farnesyl-diphosphate synthase [Natranaerobius thermophilus JW/NM-WN-LF]
MSLDVFMKNNKNLVDQKLQEYLPNKSEYPTAIHEAMHYSVFAGGKRLRPLLTLAAGDLFGANKKTILPFACAIELIHTYSLIHDDLPALDNDDLRRGKSTNHVVFGEDIAILAGDALLNYAFELMTSKGVENFTDARTPLWAISEVAKASGTKGMIGGQVVDIKSEKNADIDLETVSYIHKHKTGALFTASIRIGAILSQASQADLEKLTTYAQKLGLAFQVVDDILDIEGDEQKLGKTVGKDDDNEKATYPKIMGLKESHEYASRLHHEALTAISDYGEEANILRELANKIVNREK